MKKTIYILLAVVVLLISGCEPEPPSADAVILSFNFKAADNNALSMDVTGVIDGRLIILTAPQDAKLTALIPEITISEGASISPASGAAADFSSAAVYTVLAEDEKTSCTYFISVSTVSNK